MAKITVSASYHANELPAVKEGVEGHAKLDIILAGDDGFTTEIKQNQDAGITLIGNRIKIKDLGFDQGGNLLWLEKTNAPYLPENIMPQNQWVNLYEHVNITNIFDDLPERIIDFPAGAPNGNRTLDFALCIPLENENYLYIRATQTINNNTCVFIIHDCCYLTDNMDEFRLNLQEAIGTDIDLILPDNVDIELIDVEYDTENVYRT